MKMMHKRLVAVFLMLVMLLSGSVGALAAAYISEPDPDTNNSPTTATELPYKTWARGAIDKSTDKDYYRFSVDGARMIEFKLRQWGYRTSMEIYHADREILCYKKVLTGAIGSSSETFTVRRNLIPGNYLIVLTTAKAKQLGRYWLGISDLKAAAPGIMFAKANSDGIKTKITSARVTKSFTHQLEIAANPSYFDAPTGVTYRSNNKRVATVDSATGLVTGVAYGSAIITATTTDGKTATCRVTVASNLFSRATPKISSAKKLYGSVARMLYTPDALVVYMYLINRTGKPFEGSLDLKAELRTTSLDDTLLETNTQNMEWKPRNGILPSNVKQTIKFVFSREKVGKQDIGGKGVYLKIVPEKVNAAFEMLGKP